MGACASAPKTRGDGAWDDDVHDTSGHDSSHSGRGGARWFAAEPVDVVTTFTGRERFADRGATSTTRSACASASRQDVREGRPFKYASTGGSHVLSLDIDSDAAPPPPSAHHARRAATVFRRPHTTAAATRAGTVLGSSNHDSASSTVANAAAAACAETVDAPALNRPAQERAQAGRLSATSASSERDRSTSNDAGSSDEHTSDDDLVALENARDDSGWPAWIERHAGEDIRQRRWLEPRDMQSYRRLDKVGQGTYSTVYRGQDLTDGRVVALKHIRLANMDDDSLEFMAREIDVLARLGSHPSVVSLLDVACGKTKSSMYLVFEYVEHDLAGLLSVAEKHSLLLGQVKRLASQLLSALSHCHARGVMHRDIKGSNLLVSDEGTLKLADFGLARRIPRGMEPLTNRVVTLWYRPRSSCWARGRTTARRSTRGPRGASSRSCSTSRPSYRGGPRWSSSTKYSSYAAAPTRRKWRSESSSRTARSRRRRAATGRSHRARRTKAAGWRWASRAGERVPTHRARKVRELPAGRARPRAETLGGGSTQAAHRGAGAGTPFFTTNRGRRR